MNTKKQGDQLRLHRRMYWEASNVATDILRELCEKYPDDKEIFFQLERQSSKAGHAWGVISIIGKPKNPDLPMPNIMLRDVDEIIRQNDIGKRAAVKRYAKQLNVSESTIFNNLREQREFRQNTDRYAVEGIMREHGIDQDAAITMLAKYSFRTEEQIRDNCFNKHLKAD